MCSFASLNAEKVQQSAADTVDLVKNPVKVIVPYHLILIWHLDLLVLYHLMKFAMKLIKT
jgi:hypothetical protein